MICIPPKILDDSKIKNLDDHLFRRWIELQLAFIDDTSIDLEESYWRLSTSREDIKESVSKLYDLGLVEESRENTIDFIPFNKYYYYGQILDTPNFLDLMCRSDFNPFLDDLPLIQKYYTWLDSQDGIHFIEHVPDRPGVYFFFDVEDHLCYIGSSKNLDMRIPQSFREREGYKFVNSIAYCVTESEKDARELENYMIWKYKPTFNIDIPNHFVSRKYPVTDAYSLEREKVQVWSHANEER